MHPLCLLLFLCVHFRNSGLEVEYYRHFKPETCGFDAEACYEDLRVSISHDQSCDSHVGLLSDIIFNLLENTRSFHDIVPCLWSQSYWY